MNNPFKPTILLCAIILLQCAGTSMSRRESTAAPPVFNFAAPSTAPAGSGDVVFALVAPSYSENQTDVPQKNAWSKNRPFTDFSKNMASNFKEILTARGFTLKGSFASYDEMTDLDKKESNLILQPILEFKVAMIDLKSQENENWTQLDKGTRYSAAGNASVSGSVTLSIYESTSKERMWSKSINVVEVIFPWVGEHHYFTPIKMADFSDNGIRIALENGLLDLYMKIMQSVWDYLNPEEMKLVKKQAAEIRAKKGY